MHGFFQSYYQGASGKEEISSILKKEIDEQEAKFLVRLMDRNSQGYVTYEE
jgi:Ca2+-binding EF-hand superfamily protein